MIKHSIFAAMAFYATAAMAQIPNAGFESWTNTSGYNTPTGWDNMNTMTASTSTYTCMKGTPGSPGSSYLKLISKSVTGMGVVPGIAVSGTMDPMTYEPVSGFAYESRPTALTGKWQYMATGADQGFIAISFTKWNTALNKRDTVGKGFKVLPGMAMSWATFTLPVTYTSPEFPDSCMIVFSASGETPVSTSYLYIDGLSFTGVITANADLKTKAEIVISPNPVKGFFNVDLSALSTKANEFYIQDAMGRLIQAPMQLEGNRMVIDAKSLSAGVYFLQVKTANQTKAFRFIKE